MMTHFGRHEPLVPPSVAADDGIAAFEEWADVMGSNLARSLAVLVNISHLRFAFDRLNLSSAQEISEASVLFRYPAADNAARALVSRDGSQVLPASPRRLAQRGRRFSATVRA
jgi:hypothetical protein